MAPVNKDEATREYVWFSSKAARAAAGSELPKLPEDVAKAIYGIDGKGLPAWKSFALWCKTTARSEAVVVLEGHGEVIVSEGEVSSLEAASAARWLAEVLYSRNAPLLPRGEIVSVSGEFAEGWLTGITVPSPGAAARAKLIVGVLSGGPLFFDIRRAVVEQALATMRRLEES